MKIREARAVVTGGASGLGNAVAQYIVVDKAARSPSWMCRRDLAGLLRRRSARTRTFIRCDVTSEAEVNAAMDSARELMGGINLLVNCAGVVGAGRVLGKNGPMAGDFFAKVVHINLIGTFLCDKAAANIMQHNTPNADGERGLLVHTSSVAAFEGQIGQAALFRHQGGACGDRRCPSPASWRVSADVTACRSRTRHISPPPMMDAMSQELQESLASQVPFPARLGELGRSSHNSLAPSSRFRC